MQVRLSIVKSASIPGNRRVRDAGVGVGRGKGVGAPRREGRVRQEPAGAARSGKRARV